MKAITIGDVVVLQFESIDEAHRHGQNLADMGPVEGSDLQRYYAVGPENITEDKLRSAIDYARRVLPQRGE